MGDSKIKFIGVTVALLLHLLVALALTHQSIRDFLFSQRPDKKNVSESSLSESVMSFQLITKPEVKVQPQPAIVSKPEKIEEKIVQKYNRTTNEQPQGKSNKPKFYGDRDTLAQSNAMQIDGARDQPSIDGEKTREIPSTASNYQDGNLNHESTETPRKKSNKQQNQMVNPIIEELSSTSDNKPSNKKNIANQMDAEKSIFDEATQLSKFLSAFNKESSRENSNEIGKKLQNRKLEIGDREAIKKTQPKTKPKEQKNQPSEIGNIAVRSLSKSDKTGFKPSIEASKKAGSISRRGSISSIATEATPLGRYKKLVHNSIAKEWYRRIGQHPDLIKPGSLQVQWYVYDNGSVRGINVLQELLGSEIQKGITLQSITTAKIPNMPEALKKDLAGEPIVITITFQF